MKLNKASAKNILKDITPPFILRLVRDLAGGNKPEYSGDYNSWSDALSLTGGYEAEDILNKVKEARFRLQKGEFAYERDSVLFHKVEYFWPLLASLLWIATRNNNRLNIVDFGGSLGATYYQNFEFIKHLDVLKWNVVEQKNFAECGEKYFANENLTFYSDLADCVHKTSSRVILLSSVLQYVEEPYSLLDKIVDLNFEYVLFDRTLILENMPDRLTLQKTASKAYHASLPAWFFGEKKFLDFFNSRYDLITDFKSSVGDPVTLDDTMGRNKGYLFRRKNI